MNKNKLSLIPKCIITIALTYLLIFINYHFYINNIGGLSINITSDSEHLETIQVSLKPERMLKKYYILIYEDNFSDAWLYFISNTTKKQVQPILDSLLPLHTDKYILLEGSSTRNLHTFNIKSKYPINLLSNQDRAFHAYLIVPYNIFPFPHFYYINHQILFINIDI